MNRTAKHYNFWRRELKRDHRAYFDKYKDMLDDYLNPSKMRFRF